MFSKQSRVKRESLMQGTGASIKRQFQSGIVSGRESPVLGSRTEEIGV